MEGVMYRSMLVGALVAASAVATPALSFFPSQDEFHASLAGFNELGELNNETGAILSNGTGALDLKLDRNSQTITFTLKFQNLTSAVTQSHIHFGKAHNAGGIMVFFCSILPNPPSGTQPCPARGGAVTGALED